MESLLHDSRPCIRDQRRTGEELWQYDFQAKARPSCPVGARVYDGLYFLSPDGWFISLNAKDGKERWRKKIADEKLSTSRPSLL
jgi:alcohol dehydrogenase (cytochrome c)